MKWYLKVLKQYANFEGRARRTEYWVFVAFNLLFAMVALILDNVIGLTIANLPYGFLYLIYVLAVFIPGLAVVVRRLHDTNQSGYMVFVSLIPLIGSIWLIVLLLKEGDLNDNQYGPNPKLIEGNDATMSNSSDGNIILAVIIWMLTTRIFWFVIPLISESYYTKGWFTPISTMMNLIWAFIPLALAFSVKEKSKQTLLIVLGGIYATLVFGDMIKNLYQSNGFGF